MAFCTRCGNELSAGLRFCPKCGAPVASGPQPAPEPASQVGPVGVTSPAPTAGDGVEGAQAGQQASGPSIAAAVKDVAAAVEAAIPEIPGTGGIVEVPASAEVGKVTLSTWKSVPPVTQAVGVAVGQAQKVAQVAKDSSAQVGEPTQPMPAQAAQPLPAQAAQPTSGNQTEQFKSHGPTGRYASSGGGAKPAAEKKKSKLPLVIVAAVVVVLLAVFVVPKLVSQPNEPLDVIIFGSSSSASASASAGSAGASSGAASSSAAASSASASASSASASAESASSGSATSESSGGATSASSEAAPPAASASTSYSTSEHPTISDFKWMTGETDKGNAPAGAARITDFGAVMGGWKAYMYGGNLERLLNVNIDAVQSGAQVTLDWYYIRDNKQDKAFEDTTANSTFTGKFDGGMLDATGPGRITLTAFWEQDGRQYATGSFMWPSGETEIIALVRP